MDKKKLRRVLPAIGVATGIVVLSAGVVAPSANARTRVGDCETTRNDFQREPTGPREPRNPDTRRAERSSRRC